MIADMHPLGLGEILDRAVAIYRKNFVTLVGIVAILSIPILALQVIAGLLALPSDPFLLTRLGSTSSSPTQYAPLLAFYGVLVVTYLLQAIAGIFQSGTLVVAVSNAYQGHPTTIKQAYREMLPRWASLLLGLIIVGLVDLIVYGVIFLPFVVAIVASSSLSGSSPAAALGVVGLFGLTCLAFIPALLVLVFINIRWIFREQSIMLEQLNAVGGLRRSWNLISGSFWRVLFVAFLLYLFVLALTWAPSYAATVSASLFLPGSFVLSTTMSAVFNTLIETFVAPIQIAVMTVLYYDLRVRREGYDLELKAQELAGPPPLLPGEIHDRAFQS